MLAYPRNILAILKKGIKDCGLDSNDVVILQHMISCAVEENRIILPEEVWEKINDEEDPDILLFLFLLFNRRFGYLDEQMTIQDVIFKLPEIRREWEKSRD